MKKIWEIVIVIIMVLFALLWAFALVDNLEEKKCKPYESVGVETRITFSDGCEVFFKGEFKRVSEVNKYLEVQELKKKLDEEDLK